MTGAPKAAMNGVRWLVLIALGIAVRAPALRGEFIWDDLELIARNPLIRSPLFVIEAFRHYLFPGAYSGHYRPVQTVSYIFDYFWWNQDTLGFHATNILLHVVSGGLLFALLRKLFAGFRWPATEGILTAENLAWFVALLWIVHPVHSAAVDYLSGRADSLAFCFACGAWLLFLRGSVPTVGNVARVGYFVGTAVGGLLALCARESGGLWILIFVVHLVFFGKGPSRNLKCGAVAVCVALALIYLGLRQLPEHRPEATASSSLSAPTRGVLVLRALGDYAGLMIFPAHLHIERTVVTAATAAHPERWRNLLLADYLALAGLALVAMLIWGCVRKTPGRSARLFGAWWFLLTYLPTSNLFPMNATIAEHWLYLPSVGLLIFGAGCVIDLPARWSRAIASAGCAAVLLLSMRSALRSSDWVNAETFFRRTFAAGGASSRIGVNLAVAYAQRGEHAKAEEVLRKVLEVTPNYPLARSNLVLALNQQGKAVEAAAFLEARIPAEPSEKRSQYRATSDAALDLARLQHARHEDDAALASIDDGLRQFPGTWALISLRAQIGAERGGGSASVAEVQQFADEYWWHFGAAMMLGKMRAHAGEAAAAVAHFEHASRLDIHDVEALNAAAFMEAQRNNLGRACALQARAVLREPHQPRQCLLLAELLEKAGRHDEAQAMVTQSRVAAH